MLTMDEARGIAARIWTRTNNKRKLMDAQICEDFADVLVDEVTKRGLDDPKLKEENDKLKTEILNLRSAVEKAELQVQLVKEQSEKDQKTWQAAFNKIQAEEKQQKLNAANLQSAIDKAQLDYANLQSAHETLRLKNEMV